MIVLSASMKKSGNLKSFVKVFLPATVRSKLGEVLRRKNRSPVPPFSSEARSLIVDMLRTDIEQTEELLGFDLSAWKS